MALSVADLLGEQPGQRGSSGGDQGVDPGDRGGVPGAQGRAGVEAEPAEPQQTGADHHEREVVRAQRLLAEPDPLAEDQGQCQACGTGVDVHRGAAGEVDRLEVVGDPAAHLSGVAVEGEHPVRDREVHHRRPHAGEHHPGAELGPVGDRAADERDGDDGEDGLEADEGERRETSGLALDATERGGVEQTLEAAKSKLPTRPPPDVVAERERVAVEHPQHADEPEGAEAHHHHVEDALGADHAAVEEREAWCHEQHERSAREDPGGVAGAGCHRVPPWGTGSAPEVGRGGLPPLARSVSPVYPSDRSRYGRVTSRRHVRITRPPPPSAAAAEQQGGSERREEGADAAGGGPEERQEGEEHPDARPRDGTDGQCGPQPGR